MDLCDNINDYELLYMIYQMDEVSLNLFIDKYEKMSEAALHFYMDANEKQEYQDELHSDIDTLLLHAIYSYRQDQETAFSTFFQRIILHHIINYQRKSYTYRGRCLKYQISLDEVVSEGEWKLSDYLPNQDITLEGIYCLYLEEQRYLMKRICRFLSPIEALVVQHRCKGYTYQEIMEEFSLDYRQVEYIMTKVRNQKALID